MPKRTDWQEEEGGGLVFFIADCAFAVFHDLSVCR